LTYQPEIDTSIKFPLFSYTLLRPRAEKVKLADKDGTCGVFWICSDALLQYKKCHRPASTIAVPVAKEWE
jgi:hypothetical protein